MIYKKQNEIIQLISQLLRYRISIIHHPKLDIREKL